MRIQNVVREALARAAVSTCAGKARVAERHAGALRPAISRPILAESRQEHRARNEGWRASASPTARQWLGIQNQWPPARAGPKRASRRTSRSRAEACLGPRLEQTLI
eukprot:5651099-Pyramimonas_sp.AAC.1